LVANVALLLNCFLNRKINVDGGPVSPPPPPKTKNKVEYRNSERRRRELWKACRQLDSQGERITVTAVKNIAGGSWEVVSDVVHNYKRLVVEKKQNSPVNDIFES
jgi:hypothetical protein